MPRHKEIFNRLSQLDRFYSYYTLLHRYYIWSAYRERNSCTWAYVKVTTILQQNVFGISNPETYSARQFERNVASPLVGIDSSVDLCKNTAYLRKNSF